MSQQRQNKQYQLTKEMKAALYGFGDVENPNDDTAEMLEDLCTDYVADLCKEIYASIQPYKARAQLADVLQVLKKDSRKYARAQELLIQNEQITNMLKAYKVDDINEKAK